MSLISIVPQFIHDEEVEIADTLKYLDIIFDRFRKDTFWLLQRRMKRAFFFSEVQRLLQIFLQILYREFAILLIHFLKNEINQRTA